MSESGSGTVVAWSIEARCVFDHPKSVNDVLLGKEWVKLRFPKAPKGVPDGPSYQQPWLWLTDRKSYESAQALRWWWLAEAGMLGSLGVDTRLVREEITYSYEVSRKASGFVEDEHSTRWVSNLEGERQTSQAGDA